MSILVVENPHISDQDLILNALGYGDPALLTHLQSCQPCRERAESYRAVLVAARETLQPGSSKVHLVSCEDRWLLESAVCPLGEAPHRIRVVLSAVDGTLHGHLVVDETCSCWQDAPVRLFGPRGLVASSRIDADRNFVLPLPDDGQLYSLGLVLTRHDIPELQIIGSFQTR